MKISYPFPIKINPLINEVNSHIIEWGLDTGLFPSLAIANAIDQMKINWFAAYLYPEARKDYLILICKLFCNLFLIDDNLDKLHPTLAHQWADNFKSSTLSILSGKNSGKNNDPFINAFDDFFISLEKTCEMGNLKDFSNKWVDFCDGMLWETYNNLHGIIPDLEKYSQYRLNFSGVFLAVFFAGDLSLKNELSLIESCQKDFLDYWTAKIICLANDLCSFQKEMNLGDPHNHVILLMKEYNLLEERAIESTKKLHDRLLKEFISFDQMVLKKVDHNLKNYYNALKNLISGSNAWSAMETDRYFNKTNGSIYG